MKIHNVFNVGRLEKYVEDTFGRKPIPLPPVITANDEEEYEIERILNSQRKGPYKVEYLVRWKNYGPEEDSWINSSDMEHAQELVNEFHTLNPLAPILTTTRKTKLGCTTVASRKGKGQADPTASSSLSKMK